MVGTKHSTSRGDRYRVLSVRISVIRSDISMGMGWDVM
jgi:hypothetical protein